MCINAAAPTFAINMNEMGVIAFASQILLWSLDGQNGAARVTANRPAEHYVCAWK